MRAVLVGVSAAAAQVSRRQIVMAKAGKRLIGSLL
jgi:hypothetical protein